MFWLIIYQLENHYEELLLAESTGYKIIGSSLPLILTHCSLPYCSLIYYPP
jgi:hypothetical protein